MMIIPKIKTFLLECARVFRITKKPTNQELKTTLTVSAIGVLVIGALGFLVQMTYYVFIKGGI